MHGFWPNIVCMELLGHPHIKEGRIGIHLARCFLQWDLYLQQAALLPNNMVPNTKGILRTSSYKSEKHSAPKRRKEEKKIAFGNIGGGLG